MPEASLPNPSIGNCNCSLWRRWDVNRTRVIWRKKYIVEAAGRDQTPLPIRIVRPTLKGATPLDGNLLALHPTAKAVAMVADAILDCTARREFVLEAFIAPGTT
jgi:DNA modification methylase